MSISSNAAYQSLILKRNDWCWFQGVPDWEVTGVLAELLVPAQRLIGPSALVLYCALERKRGYQKRWVPVSLKKVATQIGLPYSTAKKALKKLKNLELVEVQIAKKCIKEVDFAKNTYKDYWETQIKIKILGTFFVAKNHLRLFLPKDKVLRWLKYDIYDFGKFNVKDQKGIVAFEPEGNVNHKHKRVYNSGKNVFNSPHTGSRSSWNFHRKRLKQNWKIGVNRVKCVRLLKKSHSLMKSTTYKPMRSLKTKGFNTYESIIYPFLKKRINSAERSPNWGLRPQTPKKKDPKVSNSSDKSLSVLDELDSLHNDISVPEYDEAVYKKGLALLPKMSKLRTEVVGPERMSPKLPDELKVKHMIDDYNQAVEKVYGEKSYVFMRGDFRKAENYKTLKTVANEFVTLEVSSLSWSLWVLDKFKNMKDGKFTTKPPKIGMVYSLKLVKKWNGWFKKTNVNASFVKAVDEPHITEQHLRLKEARQRLKGVNNWFSFPPWYVDLRQEEIKAGILDPTAVWPQRPQDSHLAWKEANTLNRK